MNRLKLYFACFFLSAVTVAAGDLKPLTGEMVADPGQRIHLLERCLAVNAAFLTNPGPFRNDPVMLNKVAEAAVFWGKQLKEDSSRLGGNFEVSTENSKIYGRYYAALLAGQRSSLVINDFQTCSL